MNAAMELINLARFEGLEHISLQVVLVGPALLKSKPPTAIQVSIAALLRAVNSSYWETLAGLAGAISNEVGSMFANA